MLWEKGTAALWIWKFGWLTAICVEESVAAKVAVIFFYKVYVGVRMQETFLSSLSSNDKHTLIRVVNIGMRVSFSCINMCLLISRDVVYMYVYKTFRCTISGDLTTPSVRRHLLRSDSVEATSCLFLFFCFQIVSSMNEDKRRASNCDILFEQLWAIEQERFVIPAGIKCTFFLVSI